MWLSQAAACCAAADTSDTDYIDQLEHQVHTLYYVGYAANTDVLFGVGGQQRFYSRHRYLGEATPQYFWVDEATIAVENAETIAAGWAKKAALAYRQG